MDSHVFKKQRSTILQRRVSRYGCSRKVATAGFNPLCYNESAEVLKPPYQLKNIKIKSLTFPTKSRTLKI